MLCVCKKETKIAPSPKCFLEALNGKIDGLLSLEVGINENGDQYDAALVSDFESMDALKAYAVHHLHVEVRDFVKKVRVSRAAVDYTI